MYFVMKQLIIASGALSLMTYGIRRSQYDVITYDVIMEYELFGQHFKSKRYLLPIIKSKISFVNLGEKP